LEFVKIPALTALPGKRAESDECVDREYKNRSGNERSLSTVVAWRKGTSLRPWTGHRSVPPSEHGRHTLEFSAAVHQDAPKI